MGENSRKRRLVLVASALLREGLTALLGRLPDVEVLASTGPANALAVVKECAPEIVVIELPAFDDGQSTLPSRLAKMRPAPRVVLVLNGCPRERLLTALVGAHACVSVESEGAILAQALDAAHDGRQFISPRIADFIMRGRAGADDEHEIPAGSKALTSREREILSLITDGKTERQIATHLGISPKTIHTHRTSIMTKLGVHNVSTLVRRALELGLVQVVAIAGTLPSLVALAG